MGSPMKRILALVASLALVAAFALPATALAAQSEVEVENHTAAGQTAISGISIDGVDAPAAGQPLDDEATVTTAEGETWGIPVLWIGDDLQLATEAAEGRTYLPALAFFVPDGYAIEGGVFTVELSDSLTGLFGSNEVVSVYIPSTGITYILPASLRDYFAPALAQDAPAVEPELTVDGEAPSAAEGPSLVDIYCAQTARDNFTDEDLEWFIDLILNKLQPQAVNLLIEKFPAFAEAAQNGGIGQSIGVYIYFCEGDKDGKPEHASASSALAFVSGSLEKRDGEYKYCYMFAVDIDDLAKRTDEDEDDYYRNPTTGKYVLLRDGENMRTLENTIIHEMFHAFMGDYNRTGMNGRTNIEEGIFAPDGSFKSEEQRKIYWATRYPRWFIEGSATAVENGYQYRAGQIAMIYPEMKSDATMEQRVEALMSGYLDNGRKSSDGTTMLIDLEYSDDPGYDEGSKNAEVGRYAGGYLATLYLSELAARSDASIGSARIEADGKVTYSADKLRLGLNAILERLHNGETLDAVIASISTVKGANGSKAPLYTSANDFTSKFIKGEYGPTKADPSISKYLGDEGSTAFVIELLDYLRGIEFDGDKSAKANGSILFDFEKKYDSPLDPTKEEHSEYYRAVEDNGLVPSTVPDSEGLKSGGRSRGGNSGSTPVAAVAAAADAPAAVESGDVAMAAKTDVVVADDAAVEDAAATAPATGEAAADAPAEDAPAEDAAAEDVAAEEAAPASDDASQPEELDLAA